jgi:uncharacterized protein
MNKQQIIKKTEDYVRGTLEGEGSGHDWWHTYRVWKLALHIGREEKADLFVIQLAALLHDIADFKFNNGDESIGPRKAREWLSGLDVDERIVEHVAEIIQDMNFKGARYTTSMKTREGEVVFDADKIDALGAIGIARCFTFGGSIGREIYNPAKQVVDYTSADEYKDMKLASKNTSINHFYEKLLLLKDRMFTKTGKIMAAERHAYMEAFLNRFNNEWDGKA